MKCLFFITLLLLLTAGITHAQKLELNVYAGTGLYNYTGNGSNTVSFLLEVPQNQFSTSYINNPYGRRSTFSYEAGLQAKQVTRAGILFGARAGYEVLRSQTDINSVYISSPMLHTTPGYTGNLSTGNAVLSNHYINLNPYIGYRFKLNGMSIDAMPGINWGIAGYSKEKGKATIVRSDESYTVDRKPSSSKNDVRVNMNLALNFQQWGITAGYSHGVSNYMRGMIATPAYNGIAYVQPKVYSQFISAGLYYRLK